MIPEEMQRTIQFLLDNQATHDARLAEIETNLNKLSKEVSALSKEVSALANSQQELIDAQQTMQNEFREGLQRIIEISEQTNTAVRQIAEAEARTIRRVNALEDRVDALEDSSK